jgi:hypothetical protein
MTEGDRKAWLLLLADADLQIGSESHDKEI